MIPFLSESWTVTDLDKRYLSSGQLKATAEFVINYGSDTVNSLEAEDGAN